MKKALLKFLSIYILFLAVFIFMKPIFLMLYASIIEASPADWFAVIRHGFAMDLSVAGYLTVIPGLLLVAQLISKAKWIRQAMDIYIGFASLLIGLLYCLDLGLYGSWGFRLDMTPIFYFTTSPQAAMASVEWWHWLAGITGISAIFFGIRCLYRHTGVRLIDVSPAEGAKKIYQPLLMLFATGLLFIPIRGSITVSTMNLSHAYFSNNQRLNHAAVNPMFSLLYSATHQGNFSSEYNFMSDTEARQIVDNLLFSSVAASDSVATLSIANDSLPNSLLSTSRPDIVMVILESFSSHLMPSLGGEAIATGLDSLAREGLLFTNCYASSFRTDRGLAAILGSFPAPTSTSLLKYVDKFEKLPSFPQILKKNGYDAVYYYGGDANFTNMQAYLVSSGFNPIISDKDFSISDRASKWGAHDEKVFAKAFDDLKAATANSAAQQLRLTVIQTSSSHEPFDVPYSNPHFADEPRKNAFAYTDACLTEFVDSLRTLPNWDNTLLVMLPDHYGCWPEGIANPLERHHIPLIFAGGALNAKATTIDKLCSQTDLGATLLSMLGLSAKELKYSRDILASETSPVAIFTEPSLIGIVTPTDTIVFNPDAESIILSSQPTEDNIIISEQQPRGEASMILAAKAFLRDLYATIGNL